MQDAAVVLTNDASLEGSGIKKKRPVFVLGCHRSGTSFLYHCLLSSGGFAKYRSVTGIWDRLIPLCGDPAIASNREKMLKLWLRSKLFRRTGLDAKMIGARIRAECRSGGDFLRIAMEEMARSEGVERWAVWDPDNILHLMQIKKEIPDALFLHIIRDGRDIATVLANKGWIKPFPWHKQKSLLVCGVFWEWNIRKGREFGQMLKDSYMEVRYEDLATRTPETLEKIGAFIGYDLNYERILRSGVGVVSDPNSTFKAEFHEGRFNPVGRWKEKLSSEQVATLEDIIGDTLSEFNYPLTKSGRRRNPVGAKAFRAAYLAYFNGKLWLKSKTPLGRFASIAPLELTWQ